MPIYVYTVYNTAAANQMNNLKGKEYDGQSKNIFFLKKALLSLYTFIVSSMSFVHIEIHIFKFNIIGRMITLLKVSFFFYRCLLIYLIPELEDNKVQESLGNSPGQVVWKANYAKVLRLTI